MKIDILTSPSTEDQDLVLQPLLRFNEKIVGSNRKQELSFHIKNDNGELVAGCNGFVHFNYFFVAHLFVSETLRGQGVGAKLLKRVEDEAKSRRCDHIWLDTFSFQAPGFYEKQGYTRFGELPEYPPGFKRYFYFKKVSDSPIFSS